MSEKVLFVDDDPNLLSSCERSFRRRFQVETAEGGEAALQKIAERGPFAVVVSDRQMPRMDGITLLSLVRQRAPNTVRIMLTDNADLEGAIKVVNEGNIFRFLTKPCPPEILGKAVEDALGQYRLVTAEEELLNKKIPRRGRLGNSAGRHAGADRQRHHPAGTAPPRPRRHRLDRD
jgi:DNA-binding NtrC family response regulator